MKKNNCLSTREGEAEFLKTYDITKYDRPSYTADILAVRDGKILLIKRGNHPYKNYWALVGGFVEMDEDVPQAAKRELLEETGLLAEEIAEFGTYGTPGRDPRGRIISTAYLAQPLGQAKAGDDAAETAWFSVNWALDDEGLTLSLSGVETLVIKARLAQNLLSKQMYCAELLYSDLAFDHGKIVIDGLLALRRWGNGEQ